MSYAQRLHRKCPQCNEYALPAGKIICCQKCLAIVNTESGEIIGSFAGGTESYYQTTLVPKENKE